MDMVLQVLEEQIMSGLEMKISARGHPLRVRKPVKIRDEGFVRRFGFAHPDPDPAPALNAGIRLGAQVLRDRRLPWHLHALAALAKADAVVAAFHGAFHDAP